MTGVPQFPRRLALVLAGAALLAGCGGSAARDAVRVGPQAVHPSPSALARLPLDATRPCGGAAQPACHKPSAADGSSPIID